MAPAWMRRAAEALFPIREESGFTLIEMMIGLAMGLVILAGISSVFISQSKVTSAVASRSERMVDLYLASHIMQEELRDSQNICLDVANSRIIYRPLDSTVALGTCDAVNAANGAFEFRAAGGTKPTPYLCWDRPLKGDACQELIRDLDAANGLISSGAINAVNTVFTITLTADYTNENRQARDMTLTFKAWSRN